MKWSDLKFSVFDTETTGFDKDSDRVVAFARLDTGMQFHDSLKLEYYSLVNPGRRIPPEASAIHHITDRMVAKERSLEEVLADALWPEGGTNDCMVAHNAAFDLQFLPRPKKPVLCTWRLARKLWPEMESHSNQYLRYFFNLDVDLGTLSAHHALADVRVTAKIFLHAMSVLQSRAKDPENLDVAALEEWLNKPMMLGTCRFGNKHYGRKWAEVPKSYPEWMKREVKDMDMDTRYTVDKLLGIVS